MQNQIFSLMGTKFSNVRKMCDEKGEPWFVGKDVAEVLGYSNSRDALYKHVDASDKGVAFWDTPGGKQKITTINESGLYSLIMGSKLPQAKEFKRWVTKEVLPQIRQTGGYIPVNNEDDEAALLAKAIEFVERTIGKKYLPTFE